MVEKNNPSAWVVFKKKGKETTYPMDPLSHPHTPKEWSSWANTHHLSKHESHPPKTMSDLQIHLLVRIQLREMAINILKLLQKKKKNPLHLAAQFGSTTKLIPM